MTRFRSALFIVATASTVLWLAGGAFAAERPAPDPEAGRAAYLQSCARCHGVTGKGDGVDARRFYPRPRDLTYGVYKFRSTASGTPPSDDDLFHTITAGLPGSNMPDWRHLNEQTRWQLVDYLKSLSSVFQQTPPAPVPIAADPSSAKADRAKGRALYEKLGCAACHGAAGRANGTSAAGLVDDWGMKIRPADLTQGWAYRGGADARSVMLRFLTGIDGAGMPSYAETISPEEAWDLAYYVTSLQEPAQWNLIAHVLRVEGEVPATVDDPRWALAERTDLRLRNVVAPEGVWQEPPTVKAVGFEAVTNGKNLAIRFSWDDPTQDAQTPRDGLALLLKPAGSRGDTVTLQAWPYLGAPALDLCYWSADTQQMVETLGVGFESVLARVDPQPVALPSAAAYNDGRWRVVIQRSLEPTAPSGAAAIVPDELNSVAVAVWDGGNANTRAVSPWVDLTLPKARTAE